MSAYSFKIIGPQVTLFQYLLFGIFNVQEEQVTVASRTSAREFTQGQTTSVVPPRSQ
jgi:hypothetical protein